jgi:hypothetical protein
VICRINVRVATTEVVVVDTVLVVDVVDVDVELDEELEVDELVEELDEDEELDEAATSSLPAARRTSTHYRAGLHDLRMLMPLLDREPGRTFWGDLWVAEHTAVFSGSWAMNVVVLDRATTLDQIKKGGECLVLGGGRGSELMSDPGARHGLLHRPTDLKDDVIAVRKGTAG